LSSTQQHKFVEGRLSSYTQQLHNPNPTPT